VFVDLNLFDLII